MLKQLKIGVLVFVASGLIGVGSAQAQSKRIAVPDHHHHNDGLFHNPFNPFNPYNPANAYFNPYNPISPYNPYNPISPYNPYNLYNPFNTYNPMYNALSPLNPYSPYSYYNPYNPYFATTYLPPYAYGPVARALAFNNAVATTYAYNNASAVAVYNTVAYNNAVANNTAAYYNALAYNTAAMYNTAAVNNNYASMYNMYAANVAANNTSALYNALATFNNTINNPYNMISSAPVSSRYSPSFGGGPGSTYNPYGNPGVVPSYTPSYSPSPAPPAPGIVDTPPIIPKRSGVDNYAAVHTPNIIQEQTRANTEKLKKVQRFSTSYEITSGTALNTLVDDMRSSLGKNLKVIPIPVSEDVLKKINVVGNLKNGNLGVLRDDGKIVWPGAFEDVLTPDERKRIEDTAQRAVLKAHRGEVDNSLLREMREQNDIARERLARRINDIRTMDYIEAKHFLTDLDDACRAIEKQETSTNQQFQKFITGGKTVQEVADYMVKNGLKFAPATPRDEAAYRALHSAMVALDIAFNSQFPGQNPE